MPQTVFVLDETAAAKISALDGKVDQLLEKVESQKKAQEPPAFGFGFLRLPQILEIFQISATTWWRWIQEGKAPKGVKPSSKLMLWPVAEVQAFAEKLASGALDKEVTS